MPIVPKAPLLAACSDDQAHGTAGAVALCLGASERGEVRAPVQAGGFLQGIRACREKDGPSPGGRRAGARGLVLAPGYARLPVPFLLTLRRSGAKQGFPRPKQSRPSYIRSQRTDL